MHGFLDSQTVRTIYISVIHVAAKVSSIYTCVQNLRTPSNTGKYSVFRIDSSIHFISRLLTAIFPTTNHLGTFAAWDSARSFFPIFISPRLPPPRIWQADCVPIGVQNVADTGNRYRKATGHGGTKSHTSTHVVQMHTLPTPNANDLLAYRHKVLAISDRLYVTYS